MTPLKQLGEFFDGDLHIFNDASEGLSLEFSPGMHWDHDARSIPRTHVNSMAASLAAQFKTETLGDAAASLPVTTGGFGLKQKSRWA